jgi:DNA-directed RNA polymerase specialized sigma24 family protein
MVDDDEEEDDLAGEMPELDELTVVGDDPAARELDPAVVRRFLSHQRALDLAANAVRGLVPAQEVEDLAADAIVRACRARPPRVGAVLPAWLATIARRVAVRWLEKRARRAKYEGPLPVRQAREDDYTGQPVEDHVRLEGSVFDYGAAGEAEALLDPYLESIVAPHDRVILEVLRRRARGGKTYADLAAEHNLSVDQLDRRIRRFKTKYAPRVRRRRSLMLLLKVGGAVVAFAVAAAVLLYLLLHRGGPGNAAQPDPATQPLPSATASVEAPLVAVQTAQRLADAKGLRDSGLNECKEGRWTECLKRLDAARTLDPEGDESPEVQAARRKALLELQRK